MSNQPVTTCPNCGASVPDGAVSCPTCGAPLAGAAGFGPGGGAPRPVSAQESRTWAMGAHLGALAGALLGGLPAFLAPLVVWLVRRTDDPFAADHGREALNFNLTVIAVIVVSVLLGIVTIGLGFLLILPLWLILGVLWLIWTIQATVAASRGETYRYPMTIRFISA